MGKRLSVVTDTFVACMLGHEAMIRSLEGLDEELHLSVVIGDVLIPAYSESRIRKTTYL